MKYLASVMRILIVVIGAYMMGAFPEITKPPFVSGLALFIIGMYLMLQSYYGEKFTSCKSNKK